MTKNNAPDKRVFVQEARLGDADGIAAAVDELLGRLPAAGRLGPQSRVLIKPNLLRKDAPDRAVTTHPDVLRGVILALQGRGVSQITVADSPGGPYTSAAMRGVYKGCGVEAVCAETGAVAYTGCESGERPAAAGCEQVRGFTLLRPLDGADFVINLPKLKTHVLMTMSGAVKNLFGLVPGLQKAEFHMRFPAREQFANMLVDLCQTVAADVHIVDGVLGMEGDGPGSGIPRRCDLLLAGEDPYQVDLAICRYFGMAPAQTPVLAQAIRRGLCAEALDPALLQGPDAAKAPLQGFVPPQSYTGRVDFSSRIPGFARPFVRWAATPRPAVARAACIGCGKCADICPQHVISIDNKKARINHKDCIRCFCCHEVCPVHAIKVRRNALFKL